MTNKIIYIDQYINTPCIIDIFIFNKKYNIEIKPSDFKFKDKSEYYLLYDKLLTCKIHYHIINNNNNKIDRSPSPIPSNIILDIKNNLKLESKTQFPILCLEYLIISIDSKYTYNRDNPLDVRLLINKKIPKINKRIFWGLCLCYIIWLLYIN